MDPKFLNYLIMYYEIKRLQEEEHYSLRRISSFLGLNFRTVKKYVSMDAGAYEGFITSKLQREFLLEPYKEFVLSGLQGDSAMPASVVHDRLKEHFIHFPDVHPKTVYNYVMKLRSDYGIPKTEPCGRQYSPVPDLAPGAQGQVDFGEKKLRTGSGIYVPVYFFSMVLCYSRYKFIMFLDRKFTSTSAVEAHEKAFEYFGGIPREIIYDQDCVFIHDENRGDYVMADVFSRYLACRPFKATFCRAADPESKGKVENVVKYVKNNFLYNRPFTDIGILNTQALEWLGRTGNRMVHNTTRKIPFLQWEKERAHLMVWHPVFEAPPEKGYKVYKTNAIKYKGNSYSLPFGTYKGDDSVVYVRESAGSLVIRDKEEKSLAAHLIPEGKGHNVINTNHRRDKSIRLDGLRERVRGFFRHSPSIDEFIATIERLYPRYVRDQLSKLWVASEKAGLARAEVALEFCLRNNVGSGNDFASILETTGRQQETQACTPPIKPLGDATARLISRLEPGKSDIGEYESIFANHKNNPL